MTGEYPYFRKPSYYDDDDDDDDDDDVSCLSMSFSLPLGQVADREADGIPVSAKVL